MERYDRLEQDGRWRRRHQEDFCQALGKPPSAKYEANQTGIRGPTLADMFTLTRNAMMAPDLIGLLDYAAFNVMVCNTDAHAKNYSMMISGKGFTLAPIYDVMCADAWDGVTRNLAQKIAGKNRGEHLKRRHWEAFARECGLNATRVIARLRSLGNLVLRNAAVAAEAVEAMPAGGHPMIGQFCSAIERRARTILAGLEEDAPEKAAPPATFLREPAPPKFKLEAPAVKSAPKKRVRIPKRGV